MKPYPHDIDIYRGDDFAEAFRIRKWIYDSTMNAGMGGYRKGDYRDVTGYTGVFQVRLTPDDVSVVATGTVTPMDQSQVPGALVYAMSAAQTEGLPKGKLVYDVQVLTLAGLRKTYLAGIAIVSRDVSRL